MAKRLVVGLVVVAASTVGASSASAAQTIGAKLVDGGAIVGTPSGTCSTSPFAYVYKSMAPSRQASGGLSAPSYGIITRWRVTWIQGDSTVQGVPLALRTYTYNGGDSFTAGGSTGGQIVTVPATNPGVVEMPGTRLPIEAGQVIGVDKLDAGGANKCLIRTGTPSSECTSDTFASLLSPGAMGTGLAQPGNCILVQADVEPDADHDGFGDETQDKCPSNAATQGTCPLVTIPTTPGHTKCKKHRHKRALIAKKKCHRHKHHGRRD